MPLGASLRCAVVLLTAAAQERPHRLPGVETARVVVEARVVDRSDRPIRGLGPGDFRAEVDGRPVAVESVAWIDASAPRAPAARGDARSKSVAADGAPGRLQVLVFQKGEGGRLLGLLRSTRHAQAVAEWLGPGDRACVLVHDSQLRLHLDITADRAELRRVLSGSVLQRWPAPPAGGAAPESLAARLDRAGARDAASIESALEALARALDGLPGEKTVVLFGWGFGEQWQGVYRAPRYAGARDALLRARATVFALDFVDADWHTLETGLREVAHDTGGLYLKTSDHPDGAFGRLGALLAGHYVLALERPSSPPGSHRLSLRLVARQGTVLSRHTYVD